MKVLAVSDRVVGHIYSTGVRKSYSDVDLIVGCGDLPFYYLEFLVSSLDVPLLYVRGNHDAGPQYTIDGRTLTGVQGGQDLHARLVCEKGLLFAGLEGSMRYRPKAALMYTESEMRWEVLRLLPSLLLARFLRRRALDVLVTHSPPFGIHDRRDRAHLGFQVFRWLIHYVRPRYLLHGHIHVYRPDTPRVTQVEDTTVVNVYPYRLLSIDLPSAPDSSPTKRS